MTDAQSDVSLLRSDPVAQELLQSRRPAQLAYNWLDNTPRVVPIWFHWNGEEVVLGSPLKAPKLKALPANPRVAVTINGDTWPYRALLIRGSARVETVEGVSPEYAAAARRYFGDEQGQAWVEQIKNTFPDMARITIQPEWVVILDFETRFPSAFS